MNQTPISLTQHDVSLLRPRRFLNDTIISYFMQYHLDQSASSDVRQQIHVFNSFFFSKIKAIRSHKIKQETRNIKSVSRWLQGIQIFNKEFLVIPICERDHWILVIICYPGREPTPSLKCRKIPDDELFEPAVIVLNSCTDVFAPGVKKILNLFLSQRWLEERKTPRSFSINHSKLNGIRLIFPDLPQQKNNSDCGIYIIKYFECFLRDPRGTYLRMFRKRNMNHWFSQNEINISQTRRSMFKLCSELLQSRGLSSSSSEKKKRKLGKDKIEPISDSDSSISVIDLDDKKSMIVEIN